VFVAIVLESLAALAALIKRQPQQKQAGKKGYPTDTKESHIHTYMCINLEVDIEQMYMRYCLE